MKIQIKKKFLIIIELLYIYIPVALFFLFWIKWMISIPCVLLFGATGYYAYKKLKSEETLAIDVRALVFALLFLAAIAYYAGWGRWTDQAGDWGKHNAILADLVTRPWPVLYHNADEHSMLTYYIAQYLVPAFFGKLMNSYRLAEILMFVWGLLGLYLVYFNFLIVVNAQKLVPQLFSAVVLVFYSGPLPIAQYLAKTIYPWADSTVGNYHWLSFDHILDLQYTSNFTQLRWVFPQSLVLWLSVLILIQYKREIQLFCFLLLPGALFGVLSFAGLIPIAFGYAAEYIVETRSAKKIAKKVFSWSNLSMLFTLGAVTILYYWGNVVSDKPGDVGLKVMDYGGRRKEYLIFCFIMFLLYSICVFKDHYTSVVFYVCNASLLALPLFRMGVFNDLTMRCSIPALFFFTVYVTKYLNEHISLGLLQIWTRKNYKVKIRCYLLIALLVVGAYYPTRELRDVAKADKPFELAEDHSYGTLEKYANRKNSDSSNDLKYNYYTYDLESNFFYKYLARK